MSLIYNYFKPKRSGIFSFLLLMLASTIIPALISKKKGSGNKNNFF